MQVSNNVNSAYYASYQRSMNRRHNAEFSLTADGGSTQSETAETLRFTGSSSYEEHYSAWMAQRVTGVDTPSVNVVEADSSAVTIAECEDEGEFLGITMVPEEGQSVTYGMRAMLSDKSTPTNPIVQVVSNLGGKKEIYNVDISKVDPSNATQLEMFALLSYTDKKGITDGGTFGSHQQLEVYAKNASHNGYCGSLSGGEVFLNERFDWPAIIEKMMDDYLQAEIYNQYEDCKKLLDFFGVEQDQIGTEETTEDEPEEIGGIDKDKIIEKAVCSIPSLGISFYYNYNTGALECVDDTNPQAGRQALWNKELSAEEYDRCGVLLERYKGERTWAYKYEAYLGQKDFWDMFVNNGFDIDALLEAFS